MRLERLFYILFIITTVSVHVVTSPDRASAQSGSLKSSLDLEASPDLELGQRRGIVPRGPLTLSNASTITLVAPDELQGVGGQLLDMLGKIHGEYEQLFGRLASVKTTLKLMESEEFYTSTKTPRWTNAIYYRGQIMIPMSAQEKLDLENLERSVRHEYLHSVVHALSGGRCPGWLDEGLAQWIEGDENPALRPALTRWLNANDPVPFSLLQGGFTKLRPSMVPAAYAQSLVAAKEVISIHGMSKIARYLGMLKEGEEKSDAFEDAFGVSEDEFEAQLHASLQTEGEYHADRMHAHAH
jgi:hypothetical protein